MKQLTISDLRQILYDMLVRTVDNNVSDEKLLASDFLQDLGMDEQHVMIMAEDLQRAFHIFLPIEVTQALKASNTVQTFLDAANALLQDLDEE